MNQKKFHSKKYQSDVKWLVPSLAAVTLGLSLSGTPTTVKADSTSAANAKTPAGTAAQKNSQVAADQTTSTVSNQAADNTAKTSTMNPTVATAGSKPSTPAAQTDSTQTASAPTATQTVNVSALKAEPVSSSTAIAASKVATTTTSVDDSQTPTLDESAPKSIVIGGGSDLTKWFPNSNKEGSYASSSTSSISIGTGLTYGSSRTGGIRLSQSINLNTDDFDLVGHISSMGSTNGAGVGFIFYPGPANQLGSNAKDIGIGGILDVIGWKYDEISDIIPDPHDSNKTITYTAPYGAFTTTNDKGEESVDSSSVKPLKSLYKSQTMIEFKYDHLTHTIEVDLPDQNESFTKDISSYISESDPVYNFAIISGHLISYSGLNENSSGFSFAIDTAGGTVNYVDDSTLDTNGNPTTVATDSLSGATGTAITYSTKDRLAELEKEGYELDDAQGGDGFSSTSHTYAAGDPNDPNDPNNFTVHLKHHTTQSSVTKNVTESVHYEMPVGATAPSDPKPQTMSLSTTETYDAVTQKYSYSGWTGKGLNQVTPPPITGYTPSISYALNGGESHALAGTTIPATLPDGLVLDSDSGDLSLDYTVTYVPTKETATIDFMDETDPTNKLDVTKIDGVYGTSVDPDAISSAIKTYTDRGYVVDSSKSDNTQNVSFNDSPTIKIYLTHGQTTITPDNPTIKYPDGTTKTPTDSAGKPINTTDLTKTVSVTVQPTDKDGHPLPGSDGKTTDVTLEHTIVVDSVTGKAIEGGDQGWSADPSSLPPVDGYTPNTDSDKMPTYPTVDDLPNENGTIEVPYSPMVTINYVDSEDPTNKPADSDTVPGDKGDPIDNVQAVKDKIAELEKKGYVLVDSLGTFDGSSTTITIQLKHGTTIVDSKHPQTAGTPINPDNPDGPKWPEDVGDLTQTVPVKVQAKDKAGNPMPGSGESVQVKFDHTIVVDNVTGSVKNESWTPNSSSLPPFSGYITDSSTLPTLPTDGDTIEVTYDPVPPVAPSTPSNPGQDNNDPNKNNNGNSDNSSTNGGKNSNGSANGGNDSNGSANGGKNGNGSANGGKNGNNSTNGGKNSNGSANGGKNGNGSANGSKNGNSSANGGKNGNGSTTGSKNSNGSVSGSQNGNGSASGSSSTNSGSRLPQTGSSMMSQFIGIIMTLIAGVVGWFGFKKAR